MVHQGGAPANGKILGLLGGLDEELDTLERGREREKAISDDFILTPSSFFSPPLPSARAR